PPERVIFIRCHESEWQPEEVRNGYVKNQCQGQEVKSSSLLPRHIAGNDTFNEVHQYFHKYLALSCRPHRNVPCHEECNQKHYERRNDDHQRCRQVKCYTKTNNV